MIHRFLDTICHTRHIALLAEITLLIIEFELIIEVIIEVIICYIDESMGEYERV